MSTISIKIPWQNARVYIPASAMKAEPAVRTQDGDLIVALNDGVDPEELAFFVTLGMASEDGLYYRNIRSVGQPGPMGLFRPGGESPNWQNAEYYAAMA